MRKAAGLTQAELAEDLGVSQARISKIEHGEVSGIELVRAYIAALGGNCRRDSHPRRPYLEGRLTTRDLPWTASRAATIVLPGDGDQRMSPHEVAGCGILERDRWSSFTNLATGITTSL